MYEVFDQFLSKDTWHEHHPVDDEHFLRLLAKIVWNKDFSAESMADYMSAKVGVSRDGEDYRSEAINRYTHSAWAVRDFLRLTGATVPHD